MKKIIKLIAITILISSPLVASANSSWWVDWDKYWECGESHEFVFTESIDNRALNGSVSEDRKEATIIIKDNSELDYAFEFDYANVVINSLTVSTSTPNIATTGEISSVRPWIKKTCQPATTTTQSSTSTPVSVGGVDLTPLETATTTDFDDPESEKIELLKTLLALLQKVLPLLLEVQARNLK